MVSRDTVGGFLVTGPFVDAVWLGELARHLGRTVIDCDDLATRAAVRSDPARFVEADQPVLAAHYALAYVEKFIANAKADGTVRRAFDDAGLNRLTVAP